MLQVGWIFILQLLIPIYLITLRLVICFEALKGLILVFSLTFFRLHLIGIQNEPNLWGASLVRHEFKKFGSGSVQVLKSQSESGSVRIGSFSVSDSAQLSYRTDSAGPAQSGKSSV